MATEAHSARHPPQPLAGDPLNPIDSPPTSAGNDKEITRRFASLPRPALRPDSIRILHRRIDKVCRADALEWVRYFLLQGRPSQIVTANPLMLLESEQDETLAEIFEHAALVVPESSGVAWAAEQCGTPLAEFVPGIDLLQALCGLARDLDKSVFLLGAAPGVAEQAANGLCARYPGLRIAGTQHGYFQIPEEELAVVAHIREQAPALLFVGLSVPHQELWIHRHLAQLGVPVVMGVGGSFDVLSGRLRRAPPWMRELGLEWLFRTLQQPWRLKRVIHLPLFVYKILSASGNCK